MRRWGAAAPLLRDRLRGSSAMLAKPAGCRLVPNTRRRRMARPGVGLKGTEEDLHMDWNPRLCCLIVVVGLALSSGAPHGAYAADQSPGETLALPDLIKEALAKNPEIQAARKQWEASASRIAQARSLDDPTLQGQWWNAPESFNLGRSQNTIIGLSQKFPFPGKLSLKEEVANRSAEITEQALRAKERALSGGVTVTY